MRNCASRILYQEIIMSCSFCLSQNKLTRTTYFSDTDLCMSRTSRAWHFRSPGFTQPACQGLNMVIFLYGNKHSDFKVKLIKSKISMYYMINSNTTNSKHEYKVKYEGY